MRPLAAIVGGDGAVKVGSERLPREFDRLIEVTEGGKQLPEWEIVTASFRASAHPAVGDSRESRIRS
jgi:hypothetical protein